MSIACGVITYIYIHVVRHSVELSHVQFTTKNVFTERQVLTNSSNTGLCLH